MWYLAVLVGSGIFLLPILWAVSTSLKLPGQVFAFPPQFIPRPMVWENYVQAWTGTVPFNLFFRNSLIITIIPTLGTILSCSLVAYGFALFRFPFREALFLIVLATLMIPVQVTVIPTYIIFRYLGWLDTYKPFIVPSFFADSAFSVFLLRQFYRSIPQDLVDSAKIDGASFLRIFWSIFVPLGMPALATVAIFHFLSSWNDLWGPLIFLNSEKNMTVTFGLTLLRGKYGTMAGHSGSIMAGALLGVVPMLILYFVGQRYFVQGLARTGLKG